MIKICGEHHASVAQLPHLSKPHRRHRDDRHVQRFDPRVPLDDDVTDAAKNDHANHKRDGEINSGEHAEHGNIIILESTTCHSLEPCTASRFANATVNFTLLRGGRVSTALRPFWAAKSCNHTNSCLNGVLLRLFHGLAASGVKDASRTVDQQTALVIHPVLARLRPPCRLEPDAGDQKKRLRNPSRRTALDFRSGGSDHVHQAVGILEPTGFCARLPEQRLVAVEFKIVGSWHWTSRPTAPSTFGQKTREWFRCRVPCKAPRWRHLPQSLEHGPCVSGGRVANVPAFGVCDDQHVARHGLPPARVQPTLPHRIARKMPGWV